MGMTIDEARTALGKERKYALHENKQAFDIAIDIMRKYQMMQVDYNARLKADMVAMLTEIQIEFDEKYWRDTQGYIIRHNGFNSGIEICIDIIQEKINALKAESEEE